MAKHKSLKTERAKFENHVKTLIHRLADHIDVDLAVDRLGTRLMQESLPPVLTEGEVRSMKKLVSSNRQLIRLF